MISPGLRATLGGLNAPDPSPSNERRATRGGHVAVTLVALGALAFAAWLGSVVYGLRREHRETLARPVGQLEATTRPSPAAPSAPSASASADSLR